MYLLNDFELLRWRGEGVPTQYGSLIFAFFWSLEERLTDTESEESISWSDSSSDSDGAAFGIHPFGGRVFLAFEFGVGNSGPERSFRFCLERISYVVAFLAGFANVDVLSITKSDSPQVASLGGDMR